MSSNFKVYTKGGDKGETSLSGGTRVPKYHPRVEAYGVLDELNSFIGLLRDFIEDNQIKLFLIEIQNRVFDIEAHLAAETEKAQSRAPKIIIEDIKKLEDEIDKMDSQLEPLKKFILPGGHPAVSYSHICRTICRRAERVTLKISGNNNINEYSISYLNRLSDYFFVLSRLLSKTLGCDTAVWIPKQ
ncbi:MAG: cob(I)yrinic acid a,c-diamide adenosyltransferase [Bacteroidota bacterium]|nr:cob(I)yrinic acid a,c-diamide adenosyltransferase [Bacteroidota bacterium]